MYVCDVTPTEADKEYACNMVLSENNNFAYGCSGFIGKPIMKIKNDNFDDIVIDSVFVDIDADGTREFVVDTFCVSNNVNTNNWDSYHSVVDECDADEASYNQIRIESSNNPIMFDLPLSAFSWSDSWNDENCKNPLFTSNYAWCAAVNNVNTWLQVDLGDIFQITSFATKGRGDSDQWVTKYSVSGSITGSDESWSDYGIFDGNIDRNTIVKHTAPQIIAARYLRFYPIEFYVHKSMRIEAYGYKNSDNLMIKLENGFVLDASYVNCEIDQGKLCDKIQIEVALYCVSAAEQSVGHGSYIKVDGGDNLIEELTGKNDIVVFNGLTGEPVGSKSFDTYSNEMENYLNSIQTDNVVVVVSHDSSAWPATTTFHSWGCTEISPVNGEPFVFVGSANAEHTPFWQFCDKGSVASYLNYAISIPIDWRVNLLSAPHEAIQEGYNSYIKTTNNIASISGGHNIVVWNELTGEIESNRNFDTSASGHNMATFLNDIQPGRVVAAVIHDDGSDSVDAHSIFKDWGCTSSKPSFREPFIFIGTSGSVLSPNWQTCGIARVGTYLMSTTEICQNGFSKGDLGWVGGIPTIYSGQTTFTKYAGHQCRGSLGAEKIVGINAEQCKDKCHDILLADLDCIGFTFVRDHGICFIQRGIWLDYKEADDSDCYVTKDGSCDGIIEGGICPNKLCSNKYGGGYSCSCNIPSQSDHYELLLANKPGMFEFPTTVSENGLLVNENDPHLLKSDYYSIIGKFDATKRLLYQIDSKYDFKLIYTYSDGSSDSLVWSQSSWLTDTTITGADLYGVPTQIFASNHGAYFNGLGLNPGSDSYLDGNGGNQYWWNAVGAMSGPYNGGIPAFNGKIADSSRLYIAKPRYVAHSQLMSYDNGAVWCHQNGMILARIETEADFNVAKDVCQHQNAISGVAHCLTGARFDTGLNAWKWQANAIATGYGFVDGSATVGTGPWQPNQPDAEADGKCILFHHSDYKWNDFTCSDDEYYPLCSAAEYGECNEADFITVGTDIGVVRQISVGEDGVLFVVNEHDHIYRRDDINWIFIGDGFKQISVHSATEIWGVGTDGSLRQWNAQNKQFTKIFEDDGLSNIDGTLAYVSVGANGDVWALDVNDKIYRRVIIAGSYSWTKIDGGLRQISVGSEIWGVAGDNTVWKRASSAWIQIPGELTHVSAASDGTVWGFRIATKQIKNMYNWQCLAGVRVHTDGSNVRLNICDPWSDQKWEYDAVTKQIRNMFNGKYLNGERVSTDGSPVKLNSYSQWSHQKWEYDAVTKQIKNMYNSKYLDGQRVSTDDSLVHLNSYHQWSDQKWYLDLTNEIVKYNPADSSWTPVDPSSSIAFSSAQPRVSVGSALHIWRLSDDNSIWKRDTNTNSWIEFDAVFNSAVFQQVSIGYDATMFAVTRQNEMFRLDLDGVSWAKISTPTNTKQISVASATKVWAVGPDNSVYEIVAENEASDFVFTQIDGALAQVSLGYDGTVWGIGPNDLGRIYRRDDNSWTLIAGSLKQISVGSSTEIWGVASDNTVWRRDTVNDKWIQIPGTLKYVSVSYDEDVWGINAIDEIFEYQPATNDWKRYCGYLTQISVGSAHKGSVRGVNVDGKIFKIEAMAEEVYGGQEYVNIKSVDNEKCLDLSMSDDSIVLHACTGETNQKWYYDESTKQIKSLYDGKCVDLSMSDGSLILWGCHDGDNQKWDYDESTKRIKSLYDEQCLTVSLSEASVELYNCHDGDNQKWDLISSKPLSAIKIDDNIDEANVNVLNGGEANEDHVLDVKEMDINHAIHGRRKSNGDEHPVKQPTRTAYFYMISLMILVGAVCVAFISVTYTCKARGGYAAVKTYDSEI